MKTINEHLNSFGMHLFLHCSTFINSPTRYPEWIAIDKVLNKIGSPVMNKMPRGAREL